MAHWSRNEMLVVAGARALAGRRVCFVGIGLPNIAVALAQRTVAPDIAGAGVSAAQRSAPSFSTYSWWVAVPWTHSSSQAASRRGSRLIWSHSR